MAEANAIERSRKRSVVPRVEGQRLAIARTMLLNAGFSQVEYRLVEAYAQDDVVVSQEPTYGILADVDNPVALNVAQKSWVNFLPSAYRQSDAVDQGFLRRFLFIFQHIFAGIEWNLHRVHEILDPVTAPPDFIPWLASWVGLVMAPEWDDTTRRRWVREAPRLYAMRGTRESLRALISVFTGLDVEIEENRWPYRGIRASVSGRVGVDSVVMAPVQRAHAFVVNLPVAYEEMTEQQVLRLHQVIQMEKPAHTTYFVCFMKDDDATAMSAFMKIGASAIGLHGNQEMPLEQTEEDEERG